MTKPQNPSTSQSHPAGAAAPARSRRAVDAKILAIWIALAIYLAAFYYQPLDVAGAPGTQTLRRGHVLVSLLVGDELVRTWLEGCTAQALVERAHILAVAAAIFAVALAVGWIAMAWLGANRGLTRLENFVFSAGTGLNLVSLATLALGLAGQLGWVVFAVIGLLMVGAAAVYWLARMRAATSTPPELPTASTFTPDVRELAVSPAWLWLGLPFVVVITLGAMLPPVEFDVLEYHLQAPKEFYLADRITFLAHNVYANMPLGAEMLSLAAMVVTGDWQLGALIGKTLIAWYAPLAALVLVAAGRRLAVPGAGIVAALVYISIPWIALVSTQGLVEGAVSFYMLAAVFAAILWLQADRTGARSYPWLALAGFLAGGAVSCKYPAVVFCLLPLACWILLRSFARAHVANEGRLSALVTPLAIFLLASAAGCGLWFAKNAALTDNPTYPLLYDWFDGLSRTAAKNDQWNRAHNPPNFALMDLARRAARVAMTSDWQSPLLVPLAVLAALSCRRRLARGLAIGCGYVFVTWWLFTHRIDRFWVPVLGLASLLAGIGATWSASRAWRITLAGWLVFALTANFATITSGVMGDNRFLAELDVLRHEPGRMDPWHSYLNAHAAEISRVLLVGDAQPFDLEVPVDYNTVFDDCIFETLARGRTPRQLQEVLAEQNISHIYVAWGEVARYRAPGNYGFTRFIAPQLFHDLVAAGVLSEVPPIPGNVGQLFRVAPLAHAPR